MAATYRYWTYSKIMNANGAWGLVVRNPAASGKVLRIYRVFIGNRRLTSATGGQQLYDLLRLSGISTLSASLSAIGAIFKHDTNSPASVIECYDTVTTFTYSTEEQVRRVIFPTEEWGATWSNWMSLGCPPQCCMFDAGYSDPNLQPLVIREGEAFGIRHAGWSGAGNLGYLDFTVVGTET